MRKAFRHTGVLMMLGVVALGLVGAAYTLWFEQLQINTTVSTGSLNADLSYHAWVAGSQTSEGTFGGNANGAGKPVVAIVGPGEASLTGGVATMMTSGNLGSNTSVAGWNRFTYANFVVNNSQKPLTTCQGEVASDNSNLHANDSADNNVLNLTMGGLFPYAGCEFQLDVHNAGTVPFHVAVTKVSATVCDNDPITHLELPNTCVPMSPNNLPWTRGFDPTSTNFAACKAFLGADWPWAYNAEHPEGVPHQIAGVQVHEGNDLLCNVKFILDENASAENHTYHVHVTYAAYQWNETPNLSILPATNP